MYSTIESLEDLKLENCSSELLVISSIKFRLVEPLLEAVLPSLVTSNSAFLM